MKHFIWLCLLLWLMAASSFANKPADTLIRVGNADNRVDLSAGSVGPQLLRLADSDGAVWTSGGSEALIGTVTVNGKPVALHWRYDAHASRFKPAAATLVYTNAKPDLRLLWEWRVRAAHGPIEHTIRIENRSTREIWIPLQDTFDFHWKVTAHESLQQVWIDKGISEPPPIGTHVVNVPQGYAWHGESSTFAQQHPGPVREMIPWFMLRRTGAQAAGWYVGVEFSGRVAMTLHRHADSLEGVVGLNPDPGPFRTRIAPGGSFAAPAVFVGAGNGDIDDTGNTLRRWVRSTLNDPATLRNPKYPMVTNNSWGSAMAITGPQARGMIDDARKLGFEMFHLDAGWFRGVGDWYANPKKFPQGIAALADYAHRQGLKFGLWVDWAQAGTSTHKRALNVADPHVRDWLTTDPPPGWKPAEFKGITIDLGVPAAKAWAAGEVNRIVHDYHVDMLEHDGYVVAQGCDRNDHPHAPIDPAKTRRYTDDEFLRVDSSNSTDVSLHATNAYYAIQSGLKRKHPGLLLEICNDGGRMVDFGSAAHGDYFSIVDSYDPLSNRQAFYDASHVLPSAMLETYVKSVPTPSIENFRYMLRSGMMGWVSVMIDTNAWTQQQHVAAAREIAFYKSTLRALIRNADLYHVSPRPDGKSWDGMEYFDAQRQTGVLYAFHAGDATPASHAFRLKGLKPAAQYTLHFRDGSSANRQASGSALMQTGIEVSLPMADTSELVEIDAVKP
ncbi:MAG: alpha-galactosidase [Rudaea sp.]